jgi:hypothetical protein
LIHPAESTRFDATTLVTHHYSLKVMQKAATRLSVANPFTWVAKARQ